MKLATTLQDKGITEVSRICPFLSQIYCTVQSVIGPSHLSSAKSAEISGLDAGGQYCLSTTEIRLLHGTYPHSP